MHFFLVPTPSSLVPFLKAVKYRGPFFPGAENDMDSKFQKHRFLLASQLSRNDENPPGLLQKPDAPEQKPCHALLQVRRDCPPGNFKDSGDLPGRIAGEDFSAGADPHLGPHVFQPVGQVQGGEVTITFRGIIPPFLDNPAADKLRAKTLIVEKNPRLRIVIGPQVLDGIDLPDELCKLSDEVTGLQISDHHDGAAGVAVLDLTPDTPVMGLEKEFSDTSSAPDLAAVDEEHPPRIIPGKGPADLAVEAARRNIDFDRAGNCAAVGGPAEPEGIPITVAGDGPGVKPDAGLAGPEDLRPQTLAGMADLYGNPIGHKGPQRPDELALAPSDRRFIVQDFEHPEAP